MLHSGTRQRFQSPKLLKEMLVIILFIFGHRISAYDLYSELQYLEGSCYPNDTCSLPRSEDQDHLWGAFTCECGVHCLRYGTCCADSPHHGKMLHVEYRGERCQTLAQEDDPEAAWVVAVSKCSDRWRYEFQAREKCEGVDQSRQEDPFMAAPVTSLATGVTYKNYFCALCNYDTRDLSMWNIALTLTFKGSMPIITKDYVYENMVYEIDKWGVHLDGKFRKLQLRFELPPSIRKFVKKCHQATVTQCDPSCAYNYELQYKCLSYYSPITVGGNKNRRPVYRNMHCAMCNNLNTSSAAAEDMCKLTVTRAERPKEPGSKPKFSFALLLDVNRSDGDLVGQKQVCDDDSKWDPFFKKCRTLVCALPGYVVRNGQCVES